MCKEKMYPIVLSILCAAAIPAYADLVAYWPLDEGTGNVAHDIAGGFDGQFEGSPTWISPGQLSDAALEVDGGNYVNCGVVPMGPDFTLSLWIKADGHAHQRPIGASGGGYSTDPGWLMMLRTDSPPGGLWFRIHGSDAGGWAGGDLQINEALYEPDTWVQMIVTFDSVTSEINGYINGELRGTNTLADGRTLANAQQDLRFGNTGAEMYNGAMDEVAIWDQALTADEVMAVYTLGPKALDPRNANNPDPADGEVDVPRDLTLSWVPGIYAGTHNVYLSTNVEDVNGEGTPLAEGLDVNSFDAGRLAFGETYYWRVDEVNATPDKTVFKSNLWSFEVEPYSVQIPGSTIGVTASSVSNEYSTPIKVVDGSGLDAEGVHSMDSQAMWFTASVDLDPWIQFEFDGVYKMDVMKVWNSNSAAESAIGWSVKDLEIQYSMDGAAWEVLPGPHQLNRAPGTPTYSQFDTVPLNGVAAKAIRLNIQSNWGGILMAYGLSEVQFMRIPAQARTPEPESGAVDVLPTATISWRAGREAAQHLVYLSTDANAVIDGSAPSVTTSTNSLSLSDVNAEMGITYYWRVDEVNEAEELSVWAGPVWTLTTADSIAVDDFESYGNNSPDRPFQTWLDGIGYSADEYFPQGYNGNGTGAGVGHDIWSLNSPHYDGSIMETDDTIEGSRQAMPLYYTNTGGVASETQRNFAVPQDWTVGGAKILSIPYTGQTDNTGTLYVKINDIKLTYPFEPSHIASASWKTWSIELSTLGIDLQSITKMAIGVDGNGASGMILVDDIVLRGAPEDPGEPVSLVNDFDSLAVGDSMDGVPGWEGWFGDAQWAGRITDTVAYSGTNSLEIVGTRDDVVPNWPRVASGVYVASMMQYVPTGTDGLMYVGLLSDYGVNGADLAWLGTLLSNCTTGMAYVEQLDAGVRTETPLLRDQWVELRMVLNFDADACDFYYGDVLLGTLACPSAGGFDLWPDDDVDILYIDDFRFESQ